MIDFSKPVRLRGIHAAYAQYLTTERGQKRIGGVNVFSRIMDCYMYAIIVGLKYNKTSLVDESDVLAQSVFGSSADMKDKKISSSDINAETVHQSQVLLNYIYRVVMLTENKRGLSDEEKIANAFKSENDEEKLENNLELLNAFARGGLEIMYEKFQGLDNNESEILKTELDFFDSFC